MNQTAELGSISSISALLAALTTVLGGTVLLSGRRRPAYRAFLLLCGNLLLWHLCNVFHAMSGERLAYLAVGVLAFLPVSLLGFLRTWLGDNYGLSARDAALPSTSSASRSREVAREPAGLPKTVLLLVIVVEFGLVYAYSVRQVPSYKWAARFPTLILVLTLIGLYAALGPLWRSYRSTVSRVDKRRLLYLIGIGALTISAAALDFLPSPYGRGGPALGSVLTIVYLYFLQQTLFMDRLLDINELLGKVVVLSAFVLLLSAVHTFLTLIGVAQQQVVTVVAFIILLLYEPLRTFLEGQVQRITGRERYELQQSLGELRQILPNVIEPREAVRLVLAVFEETRRLTQAAVYLLEADGTGYELVGHFGNRPVERLDAAARRPLLARLAQSRQPLTLEQLHREDMRLSQGPTRAGLHSAADIETLDAIARTLVELQASAVIGIFASSGATVSSVSSVATGQMLALSTNRPSDPPRDGVPRRAAALGLGVSRGESSDALQPGEVLLGILCIKDKDPGERMTDAFAAGELDIYAGIAAQLGITLQNSKLYDRMKEHDRLAALGQMAAGLAHEIRNPLGAIKGAAELIGPLKDGQVPDDAAEFVGIILEETRRLGRVVSQFLDYARPFRGDFAAVDINDVVRKTLALLRPLIDEMKDSDRAGADPNIAPPEAVLELAAALPPTRGDAEQLRQVFLNLGLNAVQALFGMTQPPVDAPRRLTISTGLRHGGRLGTPIQHIEIRFTDNGPGIDPSVQKNLFIPFFTTKDKGTGLGLPISQRIIENHDGFIEVRSRPPAPGQPGGGATFTVVLPVAEPA